jgi:hypothetical protein
VCSIYIHLYLWENILTGQSCWLSYCEVWYSSNLEILPFPLIVLGEFILIKMLQNHSITYSIGEQFLPKLKMISCKIQAFHICCLLLLCWVWSSLVDPCWEIYHAPKIKITHTPHAHATPTLGLRKKTCFFPFTSKRFTPILGVNTKICLIGLSTK